MSNERVKTIKERKVEEKITVRMTDTYLFDFTLYHTYSKLAGFLTNILVAAIAFMGIIMLVMGKIKPVQIIFYLAAAIVFIVYTPLLLKYRSKKQVKRIERYHVPNEMTFNDEGIQVEFADKKETYEWEQIQKVVTTPKTIGFYYETEKELIVPKPDFGDKFVPILTLATKKTRTGQSTSEIACYVEGKMLQERRNHILQKVTENGKVRVTDLSRDLSG